MILSSLEKLFRLSSQTRKRQHSAARKFSPTLEPLESRIALTTHAVSTFADLQFWATNSQEGDKIKVAAGDYCVGGVVTVTVKKLEIEGAQADHDPTKGRRTPGAANESTVAGFSLQNDKIEIEGFTIQNTNLSDHFGDGITTSPTNSGYEIEDNIFSGNIGSGIRLLSNGKYESDVEENWFDNLDSPDGTMSLSAPQLKVVPQVIPPPSGLGPNGRDIANQGDGPLGPLSNAEIEDNKFSGATTFGSAVDLEGLDAQNLITKIEIEDNRFEQSNGIFVSNATYTEISENKMKDYVKQGIQLTGVLYKIEVSDNDLYAGPTANDGILISSATGSLVVLGTKPNVVVEGNEISGGTAQTPGGNGLDGIDVVDTDPAFIVKIADNEIRHMGHDGIRLRGDITGVTGAIVVDNDISYCMIDGINLQNSKNNTIKDNDSDHNGDNGIKLELASTGNTVNDNDTRHNANNGILVTGNSINNSFNHNKSFDNGGAGAGITAWDYRDTSAPGGTGPGGVQNSWHDNKGTTANPPGLIS
jgi:parallel beta-helix repeat protein